MPEYKTLRVWQVTADKLKVLAAIRKTSIIKLLDEFADKELEAEQQKAKADKGK